MLRASRRDRPPLFRRRTRRPVRTRRPFSRGRVNGCRFGAGQMTDERSKPHVRARLERLAVAPSPRGLECGGDMPAGIASWQHLRRFRERRDTSNSRKGCFPHFSRGLQVGRREPAPHVGIVRPNSRRGFQVSNRVIRVGELLRDGNETIHAKQTQVGQDHEQRGEHKEPRGDIKRRAGEGCPGVRRNTTLCFLPLIAYLLPSSSCLLLPVSFLPSPVSRLSCLPSPVSCLPSPVSRLLPPDAGRKMPPRRL